MIPGLTKETTQHAYKMENMRLEVLCDTRAMNIMNLRDPIFGYAVRRGNGQDTVPSVSRVSDLLVFLIRVYCQRDSKTVVVAFLLRMWKESEARETISRGKAFRLGRMAMAGSRLRCGEGGHRLWRGSHWEAMGADGCSLRRNRRHFKNSEPRRFDHLSWETLPK